MYRLSLHFSWNISFVVSVPVYDCNFVTGNKKIKNKVNSASNKKTTSVDQKVNKRLASQISDDTTSPCKMPKWAAAACSVSKNKSLYMSKKSSVIETKRNLCVEEEIEALHLTAGGEDGRPCRRLTDFTFHDADGKQQPFEMLEVDNIYVSGRILPLWRRISSYMAVDWYCRLWLY